MSQINPSPDHLVNNNTNTINDNKNQLETKILEIQSGHHSEQGARPSMEDEHIAYDDLFDSKLLETLNKAETLNQTQTNQTAQAPGRYSLYGVFDGHGGRLAAEFTKENLHINVANQLANGLNPDKALTQAYLKLDSDYIASQLNEKKTKGSADCSGTTAVSALLDHGQKIFYVANAGDSRAVLCEAGNAIPLSFDHKADRPDEIERIRSAGGFVVHRRVMGELAVSRAIGDLDFKEEGFSFVIAEPEIRTHPLTSDSEFLLLACDGLYDVMTNEEAVNYIRRCFAEGQDCQTAATNIVRHAVDNLHTKDNVTAVIIRLKFPKQLTVVNHEQPSNNDMDEEVHIDEQTLTVN